MEKQKLKFVHWENTSASVNLGHIERPGVPLELLNPWMLAKYKYVYIVKPYTRIPKTDTHKISWGEFISNTDLVQIYIPLFYCDPNIMPMEKDGYVRGRQIGLTYYLRAELQDGWETDVETLKVVFTNKKLNLN